MDSSKGHKTPFDFTIGRGQVIKGWDEGIALFNKGGKGTLYIPSTLAYGARGAGGGAIQPNACLIFDVEVLGIADATPPPMPNANTPTQPMQLKRK
jgi:peptidylprolyl isomerase